MVDPNLTENHIPITLENLDKMNPDVMARAAEIAQRLIAEEGYGEEQAYQIALEQVQEEVMEPNIEDLEDADISNWPIGPDVQS